MDITNCVAITCFDPIMATILLLLVFFYVWDDFNIFFRENLQPGGYNELSEPYLQALTKYN